MDDWLDQHPWVERSLSRFDIGVEVLLFAFVGYVALIWLVNLPLWAQVSLGAYAMYTAWQIWITWRQRAQPAAAASTPASPQSDPASR